ncbi:MAG TPA: FecR domain-containing protein [Bacteroidales bacterium]
MVDLPKYDVPWDLIAESFTGTLSVEGESQLQQWLTVDAGNREKFEKIRELWEKGVEDYALYRMASEKKAWDVLKDKLDERKAVRKEVKVTDGQFTHRPSIVRRLIAVAAVFIVLFGIGLWVVLTKNKPEVFETTNIQKNIILSDGSAITLQTNTKIEVPHDYNRTSRTVNMVYGEAYFNVGHREDKPFMVELGKARIRDIGTSFTIRKGEEEIDIAVTSGKVAFMKLSTKETRELKAGTSLTFDVRKESFGEIQPIMPTSEVYNRMLSFENTPLSEVVVAIQTVYGKKVMLSDESIANKRITAQLGGKPFKLAMEVICKSLGLEYSAKDSVFVLKEIKAEQP